MNKCRYMLVLCFGVVLSAWFTMAINSFELHTLMNKLDYLKDKLQDVEQTVKGSLKESEHRLQEKLIKEENYINEKIDSLKKIVKTSEENTRTNLEEVKNQLISRIDTMQLQLSTETKTIQQKTQTELKQLGDNKKTLDLLTDSVRNINLQGKLNTRLLNSMHNFHGGWTVIQHRFDGSVDFYRDWTEYRNGFGNVDGEFWLGLEYVHQITKNRPHELVVEMEDFHGNYGYAKYREFEIGNESEKYVLKKLGTYSGTAGDAMKYHKRQMFSTFDRDNGLASYNCADEYHGAWWYRSCHLSNLNGRYQNTTGDASAMVWLSFKNDNRGLSYSRMMIRDIIN